MINKLKDFLMGCLKIKGLCIKCCYALIIFIMCLHSKAYSANVNPDIYYNKGVFELNRNNYNVALASYLRYIQIEEQSEKPDLKKLMLAYLGASAIYDVYTDYEQALDFLNKGKRLSITLRDENMEFKFTTNMVGVCCESKRTYEAEKYNETLIKRFHHVDKKLREFYYFFNKGYIAKNRGNYDDLVLYMSKTLECINKYHLDKNQKIYPYSDIFLAYEREGKYKEALATLEKYYSLAKVSHKEYLIVDCFKGFMRLYTKLGNKEKALYYQDQYFKYSDSLLNIKSFNKIRSDYQTGEKKKLGKRIDSLEKTSNMQQKMLIIVLIGLIIAIIVVAFILRQKKRLDIANSALYKKNKELIKIEKLYRKISIDKDEKLLKEHNNSEIEESGNNETYQNEELLRKIRLVMEDVETFCNPDFSLPMLAKMVDSNTFYVSQVINSTYNENFRTFIYEYRVKEAMNRLVDTETYGYYNIHGIAESVGYKSTSNFISAFKKVTGMTPSLYKKMAMEEKNRIDLKIRKEE
jgi:AraC-like DNA-binding protein